MSERSISENNKLWEAAEKIAEKAVADKKLENEEERRKMKKRIIKLSLLMTLIAFIIVFASIAWFAMNKAVTADTMAIEANGSGLNLATSESKVSYESVLKTADNEYVNGTSKTLKDKNGTSGTYYMLSGGQKLILQCRANADDATTGNKNVQPSDWDKLNLYVVPSQDGAVNATIHVEVIPFAEVEKKDENGAPIYKKDENNQTLIDPNTNNPIPETELIKVTTQQAFTAAVGPDGINNSKAVEEAANYVAAANYLKGHIMFFRGLGDTTNSNEDLRYYFTTPCTNGEFEFSEPNAQKNTAYEVPLYWMWPNTLGQIALSDKTLRKGMPVVSDSNTTEKNAVVQYLVDNKSSVFANSSDITESTIRNAGVPTNFKHLSDGYNKADLTIGSYISYFMIEITVSG